MGAVFARISFFVNAGVRFVEEHAKLRAMAVLWEELGRERYGVTDPAPALPLRRAGQLARAHGVTAENNVMVVVLVVLAARARTGRARDDRDDARRLIGEEIKSHIEALAAGWLEARAGRGGCRPATDRFGQEIELFIGEVLWRRAERSEPWLRDALREILVLERHAVYDEVRARVEAHLPAEAVHPARPRIRA